MEEASDRPSFSLRVMAEISLEFSCQTPLPRDDAEFHDPARFPDAITRPNGSPSGVKNPALMAASALQDSPAASAVENIEAGPPA